VLDSREPPGGDFVAFVEKIEREQLARAMLPHKLPHLSAGGKVVTDDTPAEDARALSTGEAQRVLQMLKTQGKEGTSAPLGAMVGVMLGAALIAFGLLAEGGFVLLILGAVLLWHGLRTLRRAPGGPGGLQQHIDRAFGQKTTAAPRRDGK
jgi:hypothetical protein